MKKSIICTILGITVGLGLGKMTDNVETIIIRDEKNVELETIHTYLEKFVEVSDHCKICGEKCWRKMLAKNVGENKVKNIFKIRNHFPKYCI